MNPIRIFIGTDIHNVKAEQALIYSIRRNTTREVEIHLMDQTRNRGEEWQGWQNTGAWATCFSCFRWAIPAACRFEGRAIYLDSDQLVLGDIGELFDIDMEGKAFATSPSRESSVAVFDCQKFAGWEMFSLDHLKANAAKTGEYYQWLKAQGEVSFFPQAWNELDELKADTKLIHYTKLPTQPWHPRPDKYEYKPHPDQAAADLWFRYYVASFEEA
tara:strand:- start:1504 stop:2151 length:648 start_codon:yes stop_codon:yes gene_type:complete